MMFCQKFIFIIEFGNKEVEPLNTVNQIKYLGLFFVEKLNWKYHIHTETELAQEIVSYMVYGADKISMLRIYRAIVRSKCDYGFPAYLAAAPTLLNTLN